MEMKNRKLNDVVNKAIYGQTQGNIDKTMTVFKRNPKMMGDERMQNLMHQKPVTVENALGELQDRQDVEDMDQANSRARTPFNDHRMSQAQTVEKLERLGDAKDYHYPGGRPD